ncbi:MULTISPECIES: DUF6428 family protein [unclassified Leeuwenhoekiella]|uniref:DUF6428 family protein n=1 Tax=unclassified Leeuwenhoekiella TaxID=2615029 RepID=UPI000C3D5949|nr:MULTISPECIES: DUF6428 family protein [unclassified Leeuwenhoekiella]MAW95230.1 hypothetical protein [Leeuwenhoekiella sp.]MBA81847.1 hypothetical protein [Leeuwenhoekiella sp.]|tara:strand:- start:2334 stop:2795 length:462 start_codon:yes stop_codon:yes gene_type:complete
MKLSELKKITAKAHKIGFELPDGKLVPAHFHVTEVGQSTKRFMDCGGKLRTKDTVVLQLWNAQDYNHRLHPEKLLRILEISEKALQLQDLEIEVEYQAETIAIYGLDYDGKYFKLTSLKTDCLAKDACGVPQRQTTPLINAASDPCIPGNGCC